MGHDGDQPLTATYTHQRPPWIGLWSTREYKGRPDWWKEPDLKDDLVRSGKMRFVHARYREEDPDWYDPKVPDGTSLSGPMGLDSKRYPNLTIKGDQPGHLDDFQDKVYKGSHQYKAIAEKYNLSKEHPGFDVNPTLNDLINTPKNMLGRNTIFPIKWHHFGPRFFDTPLNEGSFTKGLCCAKYAAIFMLPYTMLEIRAFETVKVVDFSPKNFIKRYLKLAPKPTIVAFTWGFALSASASLRNKDDVYNHFTAGAATGAVIATLKDNVTMGISAAILTTIVGIFWQYSRISDTGLQTKVGQPQSSGIWGGPLMEVLKKFCCCGGDDDRSVPYELMNNEVTTVRRGVNRRGTNSSPYDEPDNHNRDSSTSSPPVVEKTVAERETEALNRILQNAQEAVIDVGHLHRGGLGTQDYIERAREYEETHDARAIAARKAKPGHQDFPRPRKILEDAGNKAADLLGRNTVTSTTLIHATDNMARAQRAVEAIRVTPKQDLLIEMDF